MARLTKAPSLVPLTVGVALALFSPIQARGQAPLLSSPSPQRSWPGWEEARTEPVIQQDTTPSGGRGVFGLSVTGAAVGWFGGLLMGVAICNSGACHDEYDALGVVLLTGALGGGVGSTLLGCAAAQEDGCVPRTLPVALLGTVAAVGAAAAVASATEDGLASLVTFVLAQGLVTARRIR